MNSAISAVEIALWDILGKALGVPIYKLLGGAARERVRINKDVGLNVEAFLRAKADGYTAVKCGIMSLNAVMKNRVVPSFVRESARRLEAARTSPAERRRPGPLPQEAWPPGEPPPGVWPPRE